MAIVVYPRISRDKTIWDTSSMILKIILFCILKWLIEKFGQNENLIKSTPFEPTNKMVGYVTLVTSVNYSPMNYRNILVIE